MYLLNVLKNVKEAAVKWEKRTKMRCFYIAFMQFLAVHVCVCACGADFHAAYFMLQCRANKAKAHQRNELTETMNK